MPIGYIPDPFGHPGQVPQILSGFGIQAAADTAIHISVANRGGRFTASVANEHTDTAHRTRHTHAHGGSDTLANYSYRPGPYSDGKPNAIYVVGTDGSNLRQLTELTAPSWHPVWCPEFQAAPNARL